MGDSARRVLGGRGVEGVETAGVGQEAECSLCCARVAKEVCEREGFEPEGGKKGGAWCGVEWAVEEEMFSSLWLAAASAKEAFGLEVRLVSAEVTGAGAESSEQGRLAARERRVEAREGRTRRGGGDGAKLAARR